LQNKPQNWSNRDGGNIGQAKGLFPYAVLTVSDASTVLLRLQHQTDSRLSGIMAQVIQTRLQSIMPNWPITR